MTRGVFRTQSKILNNFQPTDDHFLIVSKSIIFNLWHNFFPCHSFIRSQLVNGRYAPYSVYYSECHLSNLGRASFKFEIFPSYTVSTRPFDKTSAESLGGVKLSKGMSKFFPGREWISEKRFFYSWAKGW